MLRFRWSALRLRRGSLALLNGSLRVRDHLSPFPPFPNFEKKALSGSIRPDDKSPTNWSRIPEIPQPSFP